MENFFNFYSINIVSYEERYTFYFVGPHHYTDEEFKKLCDSLLKQSSLNTLAEKSMTPLEFWDAQLSMLCIIDKMVPLLRDYGFIEIKPKTATYRGSGSSLQLGDLPEIGSLQENIQIHNLNNRAEWDFDEETGDRYKYNS